MVNVAQGYLTSPNAKVSTADRPGTKSQCSCSHELLFESEAAVTLYMNKKIAILAVTPTLNLTQTLILALTLRLILTQTQNLTQTLTIMERMNKSK